MFFISKPSDFIRLTFRQMGGNGLFKGAIILHFCLLTGSGSYAQQKQMELWGEAGTYAGNNSRLPFWLMANQFGTVPTNKPYFTSRAGFYYDSGAAGVDSLKRNFRWAAGSELVLNAAYANQQIVLPELYVKACWKKLVLLAGRRKEPIGIVDTTLSSGSFTWSGNALPVPKIQIGLPEYVPLGFLKNFVSLKGYFTHGWYNTPYIKSAYLHQKGLYVRLGKPAARFHVHIGINHHVTWGGHAEYLKTSPHVINGKLTDSFSDYLRGVVLAKISREYRNSRYTNFDGENRVGNHVGQYDLALEYRMKTSTLLFYNNHPFEDASGVVFRNMPDGLYGLSWKRSASPQSFITVSGFLLEYLFTKDQSGERWIVNGSRFKGNDNYFNHGQYIEGWSYFGRSMGTPLIAPRSELRSDAQGNREFFPSSSVVAYHLGMNGGFSRRIKWLAKATFSTHFGTNNIAYNPPLRQFSGLLTVDAPLFKKDKLRLITRLAYDRGDFLASSLAGYVGIRASGWFR